LRGGADLAHGGADDCPQGPVGAGDGCEAEGGEGEGFQGGRTGLGERGGGRVEGAGELGFERREPGVEDGVDVGETVGVAEGGFLAEGAALEAFAVGCVEG